MHFVEMIRFIIKSPEKAIVPISKRGLLNWMPDKLYLRMVYRAETGRKLNLQCPVYFNEKLQWLKLYGKRAEYASYVDKYAVREYIAKTIGEDYLIPLIGVYDSEKDIPWDSLPGRFVLKCNHGSHCNIICTDKDGLNKAEAGKKLVDWMKHNWFWSGRSYPYKYIKPRIVCEELIGDGVTPPDDYKIMCFGGVPTVIQIHRKDFAGHASINFYDIHGHNMHINKVGFGNYDCEYLDVSVLSGMIELAGKLTAGMPYCRCDFYFVNGRIYFGELTFFDSSGFIDFEPEEANRLLGDYIEILAKTV